MSERYPIVTDIVPSQTTVEILKNILFSQNGILTAHLSYMAQSWQVAPQNKTVGDYFAILAKNDGDILDALGNILIAFGGRATFSTSNNKNWSVQNLLLNNDLNVFIKNAIHMENAMIEELKFATNKVENRSLKTLLTSIREDKEKIVADLTKLTM